MVLLGESRLECGFLHIREPARVTWPVRQRIERVETKSAGRQTFKQKQPTPAGNPTDAVHLEQRGRDRAAYDGRHRIGHTEPGEGPGPHFDWEPCRQIEDDAGVDAGLAGAGEKSKYGKTDGSGGEASATGRQAPSNHDSRQPATCTKVPQSQVAGDFKQAIPKVKRACRESKKRRAKPEFSVHRQRRETDVRAIDVADDVADRQ